MSRKSTNRILEVQATYEAPYRTYVDKDAGRSDDPEPSLDLDIDQAEDTEEELHSEPNWRRNFILSLVLNIVFFIAFIIIAAIKL